MFGLIMILGMIVDDGIIISENTYRYLEKGYSPHDAAIKGANEVMLPVLATILTTIAAMAPLIFMKGLLGRFVKYIPFVAIIALVASLIEAFIILPSHLADFAHSVKKGDKGKRNYLQRASLQDTGQEKDESCFQLRLAGQAASRRRAVAVAAAQ